MKQKIFPIFSVISSVCISYLGGCDSLLVTLVICECIDYLTGIACALFKCSPKTSTGVLSSNIGFKGLFKKVLILLFVVIGNQVDEIIGADFVRNAVIIGFTCNELLSIIENAGLLGLPIPQSVKDIIDILDGED